MQFCTILIPYKKCVTEKKTCKQRVQPFKPFFSNGFVINTQNKLPCRSIRERSYTPTIAMNSGGDSHCTGEIELHPNFIDGNGRKPRQFKKITKKKGRYFRKAEWTIRKNKRRENLRTKTATLMDGNCCWTITGSQDQEILLEHDNPVAQLDFYVKKLKSHRCGSN